MSWVNFLQPDLILGQSVLGITPDLILAKELKGLILAVAETIVPVGRKILDRLIAESVTCGDRPVPFVASAGKPSRRKLRVAAEQMDLPFEQIAMVGDRVFTDVLAGNRVGLFTILVQPMLEPNSKDPKNLLRNAEFWVSQRLGVTL